MRVKRRVNGVIAEASVTRHAPRIRFLIAAYLPVIVPASIFGLRGNFHFPPASLLLTDNVEMKISVFFISFFIYLLIYFLLLFFISFSHTSLFDTPCPSFVSIENSSKLIYKYYWICRILFLVFIDIIYTNLFYKSVYRYSE